MDETTPPSPPPPLAKRPDAPDWAKFLVDHEPEVGRYIDRIAGHFIEFRKVDWEHQKAADRAAAVPGFIIILTVFILIAVALVLTWILVRDGALSGETFVFFIGALLGSLITFLAERIVPLLYPTEEVE